LPDAGQARGLGPGSQKTCSTDYACEPVRRSARVGCAQVGDLQCEAPHDHKPVNIDMNGRFCLSMRLYNRPGLVRIGDNGIYYSK